MCMFEQAKSPSSICLSGIWILQIRSEIDMSCMISFNPFNSLRWFLFLWKAEMWLLSRHLISEAILLLLSYGDGNNDGPYMQYRTCYGSTGTYYRGTLR